MLRCHSLERGPCPFFFVLPICRLDDAVKFETVLALLVKLRLADHKLANRRHLQLVFERRSPPEGSAAANHDTEVK